MSDASMEDAPRITTLDNGVRVVSQALPLRTVALYVRVDAGARHDPEGLSGLAHFAEHMAFKGTRTRTARQTVEAIERVGGGINAATGLEATGYDARMMAEDLGLALDVTADILLNPRLHDADIALERSVIAQEIAATEDDPEDLVTDLLQEAAFAGQPLGRPILGTPDSLERIDAAALRGFQARGATGALIVSAAGRVDHDALVTQADALFGRLPSPTPSALAPARFTGGMRQAPGAGDQAHLLLALPADGLAGADVYTHAVLASALGGGMASRLFQRIREEEGLAYDVSAFHWAFSDVGLIAFEAATAEADAERLADLLEMELARAAEDLTDEEVACAVAGARAGLAMSLESPAARAERAARQLGERGTILTETESLDALARVTAAGCRHALRSMLADGRRAVAATGPAEAGAVRLAGAVREAA